MLSIKGFLPSTCLISINIFTFISTFLIVPIMVLLPAMQNGAHGLHLTGTFSNKDFFHFLAKFGFQKVDENNKASTTGYIYGKVTAKNYNFTAPNHDMYLVVVDSQYVVQYYAQRKKITPHRCTNMFAKIDEIAFDSFCTTRGAEDFLRRIPCPKNNLCFEELDVPSAVIEGQQFTYHIVDTYQPRFWYVSLVACSRLRDDKHCQWSYNSSLDLVVDYDIWFVNGDPASKHLNPFEHQFSYELHDVLEIYLAVIILNGFVLAVQIWVFRHQRHVLLWLLTAILAMKVAGIFFNLVHISVFALDGEGVVALRTLGNFVDMCTQCLMVLELLYIAKGWAVSSRELKRKLLLYVVWVLYTAVYIALFIFAMLAVDPIEDLDEWQTVPGYCILVFRTIIMLYFLFELQNTFAKEDSDGKRSFYTKFGAGFLVWFIYLPIVALLSPRIAALWRFKTLLSIQSGADFAFVAMLVHVFWPREGAAYFDIPRRSGSDNDNSTARAALISADDDSSEDELYERQASIRLNSIHSDKSNGHSNYSSLKSHSADETTCL